MSQSYRIRFRGYLDPHIYQQRAQCGARYIQESHFSIKPSTNRHGLSEHLNEAEHLKLNFL